MSSKHLMRNQQRPWRTRRGHAARQSVRPEHSAPADDRPTNRTHTKRMALSPTVARAHFARFVERALREARKRGLTDKDIERLTGIRASTFHRWQTLEGGLPQVIKVNLFCDGLEIPRSAAYAALGIQEEREATPATLDPDLSRIARILADPSVPEEEKQAIRHTIRMLSRAAHAEREPAE